MKVIGVAVLKDLDLNLVVDNYATNKTQDPKVAGAPPVAFTCTSSPQKKPKPFIWTQDHRRDPRTLAAYYQRQAERFEMGPTVMLGLDSLRLPGRYATVRRQIWQRVTGRWVTVMGKRRELDLLIACMMPVRRDWPYVRHAHAESEHACAAGS